MKAMSLASFTHSLFIRPWVAILNAPSSYSTLKMFCICEMLSIQGSSKLTERQNVFENDLSKVYSTIS